MSDYILKKGSEGRMSISIMTEKMIGWAERIIGSTKYAGWCLAFSIVRFLNRQKSFMVITYMPTISIFLLKRL